MGGYQKLMEDLSAFMGIDAGAGEQSAGSEGELLIDFLVVSILSIDSG